MVLWGEPVVPLGFEDGAETPSALSLVTLTFWQQFCLAPGGRLGLFLRGTRMGGFSSVSGRVGSVPPVLLGCRGHWGPRLALSPPLTLHLTAPARSVYYYVLLFVFLPSIFLPSFFTFFSRNRVHGVSPAL